MNEILKHSYCKSYKPLEVDLSEALSSSDKKNIKVIRRRIVNELRMLSTYHIQNIDPNEFIGTSWKADKKHECCQHILEQINYFNSLVNFIDFQILSQVTAKKRAKLIQLFIDIAEDLYKSECKTGPDFQSIFIIITALKASWISRLGNTFTLLEDKYKSKFEKFSRLVDVSKNSTNLRTEQKNHKVFIPHLGLILQDKFFIHEADVFPDALIWVNFIKTFFYY